VSGAAGQEVSSISECGSEELVNTTSASSRQRLPQRRLAETFEIEVSGLRYTSTIGRFSDGRLADSNHKSNSSADVNARDAAIACSLALQFGADVETIRKALCRDSQGRPSGPLGVALDVITGASSC
jgi:UDP-N-acetylmuramyl tripeptide synthase